MGDIIERGAPIFARLKEGLKELQARREVDAFFGAENEERVVYQDYEALNLYIKENLK